MGMQVDDGMEGKSNIAQPGSQRLIFPGIIAGLGTMFEWYDFFIAGLIAATVWPEIFFPKSVPLMALLLSMLAYASSTFARPVAAAVFGHYGDRIGRKQVLIYTMLFMAVASFGTAAVPSYAAIGILAPVLIFALRILMGFGVGGEWQGAVTYLAELAAGRGASRGFWSSFPSAMSGVGMGLGGLSLLILGLVMPHQEYIAWGWRVPFIVGGFLVVFGVIARYRLLETHLFTKVKEAGQVLRYPAFSVWRYQWRNIILFAFAMWPFTILPTYVSDIFGAPLIAALHIAPFPYNYAATFVARGIFSVIGALLGGVLAVKYGGKIVMLAGIAAGLVLTPIYFALLPHMATISGGFAYTVALASVTELAQYLGYGAMAVFAAEIFETKWRYSGVGYGMQLGALIYGLTASVLTASLIGMAHGLAHVGPLFSEATVIVSVIGLIATALLRKAGKSEIE